MRGDEHAAHVNLALVCLHAVGCFERGGAGSGEGPGAHHAVLWGHVDEDEGKHGKSRGRGVFRFGGHRHGDA